MAVIIGLAIGLAGDPSLDYDAFGPSDSVGANADLRCTYRGWLEMAGQARRLREKDALNARRRQTVCLLLQKLVEF
jgi:hypothetical protein